MRVSEYVCVSECVCMSECGCGCGCGCECECGVYMYIFLCRVIDNDKNVVILKKKMPGTPFFRYKGGGAGERGRD